MKHEDQPAPGPLDDSLLALERMRLEEFGHTPCDLIAGDVGDAREYLMAATARADKFEEAGAHMKVAALMEHADRVLVYLKERGTA